MKKRDKKLISRGLDSELETSERNRLNELLAENQEAAETSRSWERVGDQLRSVAMTTPVPDPAVAWQDIQRAIRQQESAEQEAAGSGFMGRLRWAGALAALAVVGLFGLSAWQLMKGGSEAAPIATSAGSQVEWVVAEIPGATTMIYTDEETAMTVIWMDVAQTADPRDT